MKNIAFVSIKMLISVSLLFLSLYREPYVIEYHIQDASCCAPQLPPESGPSTNKSKLESNTKHQVQDQHSDIKTIAPNIGKADGHVNVDFTGLNGIWLYFAPELEYVIDSHVASTKYYHRLDSLIKLHVPVSLAAPRPDFKEDFKKVLIGNADTFILTNKYGPLSTSTGSSNIPYYLKNLIPDKKLFLFTKSFTLGQCQIFNSKISGRIGTLQLSAGSLKNTYIAGVDSIAAESVELDSCSLQSSYCNLNYVTTKSISQIEFSRDAYLNNISGTGMLALKSNASISVETEEMIESYKQRYGSTDRISHLMKPSKIKLSNTSMSLIGFNPEQILISIDTTPSNRMIDEMFIQLINRFKDNDRERRFYDVSYHHYLRNKRNNFWFTIQDELWEQWDDYGYDKENVFQILWRSFVFFFSINYFFFSFLMHFGYSVSNFRNTYLRTLHRGLITRLLIDAYLSFIYTLLIFWIFRIELDKLKVDRPLIFLWTVVQHLASLIILTFAVRAIILS